MEGRGWTPNEVPTRAKTRLDQSLACRASGTTGGGPEGGTAVRRLVLCHHPPRRPSWSARGRAGTGKRGPPPAGRPPRTRGAPDTRRPPPAAARARVTPAPPSQLEGDDDTTGREFIEHHV